MQSPGEWIWIDPETVIQPESKRLGGVHITLMMSPYDLPEAVRGFYSSKRDRFVIQFKYLADEPTKPEAAGSFVSLRLGEKSGRLYELDLDVRREDAQVVALMIKAIDELAQAPHKPARPDNYLAAKNLLSRMAPQLLRQAEAR
jgi:hypothetical protein